MDIHQSIRSQYHAALDMLAAAVEACPEEAWDRPEDRNRSWRLAYHALFYTHLYLQAGEAHFVPLEGHQADLQVLDERLPWPPHDLVQQPEAPLGKADLRAYLAFCRGQVDTLVPALDLAAASGFPWLPFDKLELQLYNLRHLMQHTGELYERVAKTSAAGLPWVGRMG